MVDAQGQLRSASQRIVRGFDQLYGSQPMDLRQVEDIWLELCQAVAECRRALAVLEDCDLSQKHAAAGDTIQRAAVHGGTK